MTDAPHDADARQLTLYVYRYYPRGLTGERSTLDCSATNREGALASALRFIRRENRSRRRARLPRIREPKLFDMLRWDEADNADRATQPMEPAHHAEA